MSANSKGSTGHLFCVFQLIKFESFTKTLEDQFDFSEVY